MVRITNYRRDFSEDEFQFDDWADDIVEDYESSVRENEKITKKMSQERLILHVWGPFLQPIQIQCKLNSCILNKKKLTTRNGGSDFDGHHRQWIKINPRRRYRRR